MKRWIAVALFLLVGPGAFTAGLFTLAQAQAPSIRSVILDKRPAVVGFTPSCTESTNFIARTSGLNTTHRTNYDNLICGFVTDGDYTGLDLAYAWATDTTTNALLDLTPNARNGTATGTVSFSADHGYTGDASTFFIDTGFNAFTAGGQYTLNSAAGGVYVLNNLTSGYTGFVFGADNVTPTIFAPSNFGNATYEINSALSKVVASGTTQGQWILSRTAASGAAAVSLYRNGNTTPFDTDTSASDFIPRTNFYFFAVNSGGIGLPSNATMSAGWLGKGVNSAAQARIAARFNTYMTAYGINVY